MLAGLGRIGRMGAAGPALGAAPALDLLFADGGVFSDLITFSRASSGWYPEADGSLVEFGINEPRRGSLGVLVEGARTNAIRNPRCEGATTGVVGSGGALPTNWTTADAGGLATEIIGTGTEGGVPYVDMRISGTSSNTFHAKRFEGASQIAGEEGEVWTATAYFALVDGSLDNISSVRLNVRNDGGSPGPTDTIFTPDGALTRQSVTRTLGSGATRVVSGFSLHFASGAEIDVTLRVGLPQLEKGADPTSPIMPPADSPAAATRATDAATIDLTEAAWFNPAEGTIYAEFLIPHPAPSGLLPSIISFLKDGANRITLTVSAVDSMVRMATRVGDVPSGGAVSGPYTYGTWCRVAGAWKADDVAICLNGGAVVRDTTAEIPTGLTDAVIGQLAVGSNPLNGYIRRLTYWPRRLNNEELVRKTS